MNFYPVSLLLYILHINVLGKSFKFLRSFIIKLQQINIFDNAENGCTINFPAFLRFFYFSYLTFHVWLGIIKIASIKYNLSTVSYQKPFLMLKIRLFLFEIVYISTMKTHTHAHYIFVKQYFNNLKLILTTIFSIFSLLIFFVSKFLNF